MSERGSFVTEYCYCDKCFEVAKKYLLGDEKYLCSRIVPSWQDGKFLPIIAGKVGGLYAGEERHWIERTLLEMSDELCHEFSVAVLPDDISQAGIISTHPGQRKEEGKFAEALINDWNERHRLTEEQDAADEAEDAEIRKELGL